MSGRTGGWKLVRRLAGWPLVALVAATAFVLGYLGFHSRLGADRSFADLAYLSLQLFTVESGMGRPAVWFKCQTTPKFASQVAPLVV